MPRNWFLIPAFNEEENLRWLLPNIRRFMHAFHYAYDIVVVDDGSSDGTADVVREMADVHSIRARVVSHEVNQGPGAGFRTGFQEILKHAADDDLIITIEADNTSDLCVLNRMLMRADRGHDLVLASVYGGGRIIGAPRSRLLLSHVANSLIRQAFRLHGLNTFSSFFRVHRARMMRGAMEVYGDDFVTEQGFVCAVEMLVKLHHMGYSISEVPMLLDSNIRIGDSKMKVWRNVRAYLRVVQNLTSRPGALKGRDHAHRDGV
jgi:dolichol-phosphate mannosyltransferase